LRSEPGTICLMHDRISQTPIMLATKVLNDLFDEVATQMR